MEDAKKANDLRFQHIDLDLLEISRGSDA